MRPSCHALTLHLGVLQLIDSNDRERRRDFPHVDGILYPVDAGGDVEEPFAGIFKRINRLYIAEDKRQAFRLQNTLSRGTTGSCDGIDAPHVMLGSMGASRLTEASKAADNEYGVVSVGVGSGAGSKESNDSIGASIGLPRPPTLVVRTERSPKHRGLLDPQEPQQCVPALCRCGCGPGCGPGCVRLDAR